MTELIITPAATLVGSFAVSLIALGVYRVLISLGGLVNAIAEFVRHENLSSDGSSK